MSCGKKTYATRQIAKNARRQLRKGGFLMTNVYFCQDCQNYHLTSMNKKVSRSKKRRNVFKDASHKELNELREAVLNQNK